MLQYIYIVDEVYSKVVIVLNKIKNRWSLTGRLTAIILLILNFTFEFINGQDVVSILISSVINLVMALFYCIIIGDVLCVFLARRFIMEVKFSCVSIRCVYQSDSWSFSIIHFSCFLPCTIHFCSLI